MTDSRPNIVYVTAHPDDSSNAMGATALLLKDRYDVHVLCATRGERGIRGKTYAEAGAIREKEEAAACALMGAQLTFLDRVNGELYADKAICDMVAGILTDLRPAAVFTLWPINEHEDHTAVYEITMKALLLSDLRGTTEVYMGENDIGGQTNQFVPDIYVDISGVIEQKRAMVACHRSQYPSEERREYIIRRNAIRGMMARCPFAEAFKTLYPVTTGRWGRPSGALLLDL
ncbi:MAG: PIG-L family deacetylase [Candidatus Brocadiaceae bacterium]|nr:PIG-L family deacetylase [Candidatus Brocadiaceae bacterium]